MIVLIGILSAIYIPFVVLMCFVICAEKESEDMEKKEALADIVEVVRCKDCKRFCKMDTSPSYDGKCLGYGHLVEAKHYCSYGERREK